MRDEGHIYVVDISIAQHHSLFLECKSTYTALTILVFPVSTYADPLACGTRPVFKTDAHTQPNELQSVMLWFALLDGQLVQIGRTSLGFLPSFRRPSADSKGAASLF